MHCRLSVPPRHQVVAVIGDPISAVTVAVGVVAAQGNSELTEHNCSL